jgi:hypothetical protein
MTGFESPKELSLLFIHRKNKDYIKSVVTKSDTTDSTQYTIYKSRDAFNFENTSEGIFATALLPAPVSEIYKSSVTLANYIKKNGYKVCNTIVQTKNGVKIK